MEPALIKLMLDHFPFMDEDDVTTVLEICSENGWLFSYPDGKPYNLFGYWRFYPELINVVRDQDFEVLKQCSLIEGPLVYVAVLITPGNAYKTMMKIAYFLNARAYSFHRYRDGEPEFHFFRNNRYSEAPYHACQH